MAHIEDEEYTYIQPPVIKFTANCLYTDRPNSNGRFYPREVIEKAIADFQSKIDQKRAVGELSPTRIGEIPHPSIDLDRVSHTIDKLYIEGPMCFVEGHTLNTPNGKILEQLLSEGCEVGINSYMAGTISKEEILQEDGTTITREVLQSDAKLLRFDIIPLSDFVTNDNRIYVKD